MTQKRIGYLIKTIQERYNLKRAWIVNAWRVVDKEGNDMVQPWAHSKGEALKMAKACNILVLGMWETPRPPYLIE